MRVGAITDEDARAREQTRTEARRAERIRTAHRAGWVELERRDLAFQPFGIVVHEPTGDRYRINRGEVDAQYSPVVAYFIDQFGGPVFLERR